MAGKHEKRYRTHNMFMLPNYISLINGYGIMDYPRPQNLMASVYQYLNFNKVSIQISAQFEQTQTLPANTAAPVALQTGYYQTFCVSTKKANTTRSCMCSASVIQHFHICLILPVPEASLAFVS